MALILHVVIALSSVVYASLLLFRPSTKGFYVSYGLVGATLVTGTYLVISTHSPLVSSCEAGLVYLGVIFGLLIAARRRMTTIRIRNKD